LRLSYLKDNCTKQNLLDFFKGFNVDIPDLPTHPTTRRNRGYAFVFFETPEAMVAAIDFCNTRAAGREDLFKLLEAETPSKRHKAELEVLNSWVITHVPSQALQLIFHWTWTT